MKRQEFDAWDQRIRDRAELLWAEQGGPDGPRDRFIEEARELIAIEENPTAGQIDPDDAADPIVEEAALMRNLGEFPTLTDQGDQRTYPDTDDDIHLSDDDASDSGGVLPDEDMPDEDFADVALNDADITSDTVDTGFAAPSTNSDINDDGFPDQPALDDEAEDDEADEEDDDDDEEDDDDDDELEEGLEQDDKTGSRIAATVRERPLS